MPSDTDRLSGCISLAISVLSLVFAWQCVFLPSLTDGFRQRLFSLRRRLFLYMAWGGIEAHDPAYAKVRETINALLQFAERLTWGRVVLILLCRDAEWIKDKTDEVQQAINRISDPKKRREIMEFREEIPSIMLAHLVAISFPAMILSIPFIWMRRWKKLSYRRLERVATDLRQEHCALRKTAKLQAAERLAVA